MTLTRTERDAFASTTPIDIAYGEGACLETPRRVFELLNQKFKFDVDLTANEKNHLLPRWFGPRAVIPGLHNSFLDALEVSWWGKDSGGDRRSGFSNPPYGKYIPLILKKAIEERRKGFTSVFLLPMRAGGWYQNLVVPHYTELWHVSKRLTFNYGGKPRLNPKTGKSDGALFDSIIVVYAPYVGMEQGRLFPPQVRPNVWDPTTGELRY